MIKQLLIGAAIAALTAPAIAASAPAPAAVDAEHKQLANALVRVLNSEELTRAQTVKMLDETLPNTFTASPDFAALEREYPGVTKAVIDAVHPIILNGTLARLPSLWARLAPIYARSFTTAELHALFDFYTSPSGGRLLKAMAEGADFSRLLSGAVTSESSIVTTEGFSAGVQSGAAAVIRTASPEDIKVMMAFAATPAGGKASAIAPKVQAASIAWNNEPAPELDAQIESAAKAVVATYTGKQS